MLKPINFEMYQGEGEGKTISERKLVLPEYEPFIDDSPVNYIADAKLKKAVNVAIALGMPLFVTGEPGTGKTQLAASVAYELSLPMLKFHTKTTSVATDLFYSYDALRRFHDAHNPENKTLDAENYITYQALGKAILLAKKRQTRSVVLIDEIDKAPRDLPNDILNELDQMEFNVRETGNIFKAEKRFRPIVILTSNSEKNMPDAFLRRCMFYHIPFPSKDILTDIVGRRIRQKPSDEIIESATEHFQEIRKENMRKKPGTAEFLAWICMIASSGLNVSDIANFDSESKKNLALSYSILTKNENDFEMLVRKYKLND